MNQIRIVVEDRKGILSEIAQILASESINIVEITADSAGSQGVVKLLTEEPERADAALREKGFHCEIDETMVLELPDQPGSLAKVSQRLLKADINIRSIQIVGKREGRTLVSIATDRKREAMELVRDLIAS